MTNLIPYSIDSLLLAYKAKGYKVYTEPKKLNIYAIRINERKNLNQFTDLIGYFYFDSDGHIVHNFGKATTTPGAHWLGTLMNPKGTAILIPNQYINTWKLGLHRGKYKALCQAAPVKVFRDKNKDEVLDMDPKTTDTGYFGINIHRAHESKIAAYIGQYSAGCQVIQNPTFFGELINLASVAEKEANQKLFTYTLFTASEVGSV